MRRREARRLVRMVANPPRAAPKWLTPDMVKRATQVDGLDLFGRLEMRDRRMRLMLAVMRRAVDDLRREATGSNHG